MSARPLVRDGMRSRWRKSAVASRLAQLPPVTLPTLLLLALVLWIFRRQLFHHWSFPFDFLGSYSASPAFVGASIGHGHFLSWSPYVASGFPVDVDPQSGIYFPLWWLLGALRVPLTLAATTDVQVFHVLLGGLGTLALARARGLSLRWATLAGIAFVFFGGFYGQAEHADYFRGFCYLPWLLWALTVPEPGRPWHRVLAIPLLAWLIATGAYPGQLVAFAMLGAVYCGVALFAEPRERLRSLLVPLGLAAVAAGGVALAVVLPYLHADGAGQLIRVAQPTAAERSMWAFGKRDLLGSYLNSYAWHADGSISSWAIGIPVVTGALCASLVTVRRQLPLVACAVVGLLLAATPKIGFIGDAMASMRFLFPSRFPPADYKAVIAVSIIILSFDSWSTIAARSHHPWRRAAVTAAVLILSAATATTRFAPATQSMWLLILVAAGVTGLIAVRPAKWALFGVLLVLVCLDGWRDVDDVRTTNNVQPWLASPAVLTSFHARDAAVRTLPSRLEHPPARRPARVPPAVPIAQAPEGNNTDTSGWAGAGYHVVDYGGTIERPLWSVEHSPPLLAKLEQPWQGYTFPCSTVGCGRSPVIPPVGDWRVDPSISTVSYGAGKIVYRVAATRPELLVENELAVAGWSTDSSRVKLVSSSLPFRTWRLSPGRYEFTASYHQPERGLQLVAVVLALLVWLFATRVTRRVARNQVTEARNAS